MSYEVRFWIYVYAQAAFLLGGTLLYKMVMP